MNEFKIKHGYISDGDSSITGRLDVSNSIYINNVAVATQSWVTSQNYITIGSVSGSYLPLSGGTLTGNLRWTSTGQGLEWVMNTDGAGIKFYNTGDGDTNSRLEYYTTDNGNEYHRFMIANVEEMTLKSDGLRVTNNIYAGGNLVATQDWVTTNIVNSAPAALDTLNELAAALGDDPNFATTMSTALGNRLRVDTASQGLNATQQANGRTNLGLGTAATANTSAFLAASGKAADSELLDGVNGASYMRSDVEDEKSGNTMFTGPVWIDNSGRLGTSKYTWTNSALTTTSIEIVDDNANNESTGATLVIHNYGDGGVKFRMGNTGDKTLYLSSAASNGAGSITDDNTGTYFNAVKLNGNVMWHAGNDGSGSGLDADLLDGLDSSAFLRSNANDNFSGQLVNNSLNQTPSYDRGAINLQPSVSGGSTGITFRSKVNSTSDAGYIWWYDDNDHYNELNSTENGVLLIAAQNDGGATSEDAIAIESSGDIYLNAGVASGAIGSGVWNSARGNVYLGYAADRARVLSTDDGNPTNWNTAYTDRNKWDGGATGLNAATGRTSLGLGTAATSDTGDFAAASHTHSAADITSGILAEARIPTSYWKSGANNTWSPSTNILLGQSANNQEWSFDITRNGYTGGYWQVWDSANSTMLKVDAVTGKVSAPYNFVGALEGNATTATTASKLTVNTNNTFTGTYPILWHDGTTVYSSSWMTVNGSTDTLNVSNISTVNIASTGYVGNNTSQTRDKFRVWSDSNYTIGFKSGYDFGHLGNSAGTGDEYAMSFQMNDASNRGFWWGDNGHNDNQGAMALTTDGRLNVAKSISVGEGESVVNPSSIPLYVVGNTADADVFAVDGINGRLFTVTDSLDNSLFSVNTIAGLPVIEAFADSSVKLGPFANPVEITSAGELVVNGGTDLSTAVTGATVSNDTITFTRANGGTFAVSTSDANTNYYLSGVSFNTGNGVLTFTRSGLTDLTVDLDGRYLTSYTESGNITVTDSSTNAFFAVPFVSTTAGGDIAVYKDSNNFYYNPGTDNLQVGLLDLSSYGTAAAPAIRWSGDGDTGIFSGGNNSGIIGFSTQGTERMSIKADGAIQFNAYGAGLLKTDASGNVSADNSVFLTAESDTLDSVTDRGNTTSNSITVGGALISATAPILNFVDTNSFTDTDDRFRVRAVGDAGAIQWWDNSASAVVDLMRIDSSGNVGIGTTSPDAPLHVSRSTNGINQYIYNSSSGQAYIALGNATTGLFSQDFTSANGMLVGVDSDETAVIWNAENTRLRFGTNNSERLSITGGGNVGIGTTSPGAVLTVGEQSTGTSGSGVAQDNSIVSRVGAANAAGRVTGLTIANTATATVGNDATLSFIVASNYSATSLISSILQSTVTAATDMAFSVYDTSGNFERMRIKSNGNVGIGTTSPNNKLDVRRATSGIVAEFHSTAGTPDEYVDVKLISGNGNSGTYGTILRHQRVGTDGADFAILTNPTLTGTPVERFRITRDGDVGIGTTSPGKKLEVRTPTDTESSIRIRQLSYNYWDLKSPASDTGFTIGDVGGEKLRITSTGNVGIGTTSPTGKLEVSGNVKIGSTTTGLNLAQSGDNFLIQGVDVGGNAWNSIHLQADSLDGLYIEKDTNKVGIGTTSPGAKLDIVGTNSSLALSYGNTVPNNPLHTNYYGGYTGIGMDSATAGVRIVGDTNTLVMDAGYYTSQSPQHANWNSLLRVMTNGNVGIGTTSPGAKLEVAGNTLITGNANVNAQVRAGYQVSTGDARISAGDGRTGNGNAYVDLIGDTTYSSYGLRLQRAGGANSSSYISHRGTGTMYIRNLEAAAMHFQTGSTDKMVISSGGNVGIGTISPSELFEVYGNASVTDLLKLKTSHTIQDKPWWTNKHYTNNPSTASDIWGYQSVFMGADAGNGCWGLITSDNKKDQVIPIEPTGVIAIGSNALAGTPYVFNANNQWGSSIAESTVAIGHFSMSNTIPSDQSYLRGHTAIGYNTLANVSADAGGSTALGWNAGVTVTYGGNNTLLGYNAGNGLTTGNGNVFVGTLARPHNFTSYINSATAIGDGATAWTGGVAVGVSASSQKLNTVAIGSQSRAANSGAIGIGYNGWGVGQNSIGIGNSSRANQSNSIAIGYQAIENEPNSITLGNSQITRLKCNVQNISGLSDGRDKKDVKTLENGLSFIKSINPVSFEWDRRDGSLKGHKEHGFIAQELQEAMQVTGVNVPSLVNDSDKDRLLASYSTLIPILVKAVQELSDEVELLKNK